MLDQRIATIEATLVAEPADSRRTPSEQVQVGDIVTIDFGDGPEQYLLASVDHAATGLEIITPGSPLGRALVDAQPGTTVEYRTAGRTLRAALLTHG